MTASAPRAGARSKAGLVAPFALYTAYCAASGDLRGEHLLFLAVAASLTYISERSRRLMVGLFPFGLVALLYDGMRPYQKVGLTESGVHLCDLRQLEATLFGYRSSGGEARTLHDFFLVHHTPVLDVLCAIPYATFILWCVAGAVFLYFKDRGSMVRFAWGFFLLNVAGFVTYHLLPAAPPWYFHAHGCGRPRHACGRRAGPARVDALLGIAYFQSMYAKASSVFGALPSLHCAYPLLLALEGYRAFGPRLRAAAFAYWGAMIFSAVYLDHHWVLDALLGSAYAVVVFFVVRGLPRLAARGGLRASAPTLPAATEAESAT